MSNVVVHPAVRAALRADKCPHCGGELDVGWECVVCGYDACVWMPLLVDEKKKQKRDAW